MKVRFRDMSIANKQRFNELLGCANWAVLLSGITGTNEMVLKLLDIIDKYFDMCFPIKIKFITLKRLSKPCITTALHNSIKTKHDLLYIDWSEKIILI